MNKFCPFLTSLYTITTENNKTNWIPCVNTECVHYDTKGNPACKLDIVSFSDLLIKAGEKMKEGVKECSKQTAEDTHLD